MGTNVCLFDTESLPSTGWTVVCRLTSVSTLVSVQVTEGPTTRKGKLSTTLIVGPWIDEGRSGVPVNPTTVELGV